MDCYLRTSAWLSGYGFYFNNSILNFWCLLCKEFFYKFWMSAIKTQVDTSWRIVYAIEISSYALSSLEKFSRDLFFIGQYACRAIEINIDISSFNFLHYTSDYFSFFCPIFINNRCAFSFANLLNYDLLGGLSSDASVIFF